MQEVLRPVVRGGRTVADAQVRCEVHRHVTGTAIASVGGSDGSRAQHAAGDTERSEAASAARSAREVAMLPPHERRHRAAAVEAKEERAAPPG